MFKRKQEDIIPRWNILIYKSDKPLTSLVFVGNYEQAIIKAQNLLESYQNMNDVFKATHYIIE